MRVLVDENIPRMTVDARRAAGHEVKDIRGTTDRGPRGGFYVRAAVEQATCRFVTPDRGRTISARQVNDGAVCCQSLVRSQQDQLLELRLSD